MKKRIQRQTFYLHIIVFSILIAIIIIVTMLFSKFEQTPKSHETNKTIMDVRVQQTIHGENGEKIANQVFSQIKNLEKVISWSNSNSEISEINKNSGKSWVDISDQLLEILNICLNTSEKTSGAFDITQLPIEMLWGFNQKKFNVPSQEEVAETQKLVNYKNLKVNNDVKRAKIFNYKSAISLDNVSHGLICDKAISFYSQIDIDSAIISADKSIGVYGSKLNKKPWNIAIHDPFKPYDDTVNFMVVKINNGCVSTCCPTDKSFERDGITYHHILSTLTGYPIKNEIMSITVLHQSGFIADMLSHACYSLDREQSISILNYYDAGAIFVDNKKNIYLSEKLKNSIIISNKEYTIKGTL